MNSTFSNSTGNVSSYNQSYNHSSYGEQRAVDNSTTHTSTLISGADSATSAAGKPITDALANYIRSIPLDIWILCAVFFAFTLLNALLVFRNFFTSKKNFNYMISPCFIFISSVQLLLYMTVVSNAAFNKGLTSGNEILEENVQNLAIGLYFADLVSISALFIAFYHLFQSRNTLSLVSILFCMGLSLGAMFCGRLLYPYLRYSPLFFSSIPHFYKLFFIFIINDEYTKHLKSQNMIPEEILVISDDTENANQFEKKNNRDDFSSFWRKYCTCKKIAVILFGVPLVVILMALIILLVYLLGVTLGQYLVTKLLTLKSTVWVSAWIQLLLFFVGAFSCMIFIFCCVSCCAAWLGPPGPDST